MIEFKVGDVLVAPAGESVNGNPPRKSAVRAHAALAPRKGRKK